jgi:hypothetical protein
MRRSPGDASANPEQRPRTRRRRPLDRLDVAPSKRGLARLERTPRRAGVAYSEPGHPARIESSSRAEAMRQTRQKALREAD